MKTTKQIDLRSGGYIRVDYTLNPEYMDDQEREFVVALNASLHEYEERMIRESPNTLKEPVALVERLAQ